MISIGSLCLNLVIIVIVIIFIYVIIKAIIGSNTPKKQTYHQYPPSTGYYPSTSQPGLRSPPLYNPYYPGGYQQNVQQNMYSPQVKPHTTYQGPFEKKTLNMSPINDIPPSPPPYFGKVDEPKPAIVEGEIVKEEQWESGFSEVEVIEESVEPPPSNKDHYLNILNEWGEMGFEVKDLESLLENDFEEFLKRFNAMRSQIEG